MHLFAFIQEVWLSLTFLALKHNELWVISSSKFFSIADMLNGAATLYFIQVLTPIYGNAMQYH